MLSLTIVVLLTSDMFTYGDKDEAMVCLYTALPFALCCGILLTELTKSKSLAAVIR